MLLSLIKGVQVFPFDPSMKVLCIDYYYWILCLNDSNDHVDIQVICNCLKCRFSMFIDN